MDGNVTSKLTKLENNPGNIGEEQVFIENELGVVDDGLGPKWMLWTRRRYFVVMMAFFGQMTREMLRSNLSVAILPMTENVSTTDENGTIAYVQEFEWDFQIRGLLLSAFYHGYITTIMVGGILAVKYGGTKLYGLGIGVTALTTLLAPLVAQIHVYLLIALRVFEGMCEGVLMPSMECVYARWIPLQERSSLVGFASSGLYWGVFFGIAFSSAIAHQLGWRAIFYTTGGIGVVWFMAWFICVKETPRHDKKISPSERRYIETTLGTRQKDLSVKSVPFIKILTSMPLWAIAFSNAPLSCCYVVFSTHLLSYMKDVLKQDIQISGYLSSLPFVSNVLTIYCVSPLADFLINRNILSNIAVRKLYICGGLTSMAIFSFIVQLTSSVPVIVACFVAMRIGSGAAYTQIVVNILDLAPNYASVLAGLSTTINVFFSMLAPTVTAYLTPNKTVEEWNAVFSILAGMCLTSAVIYSIFGSGQLQPWANKNCQNNESG